MDHEASIRKSGEIFGRSGGSRVGKIRQWNMGDARGEVIRGVEDVVLCRPRPGNEDSSRTRIRRRLAEMGACEEEDQESDTDHWMGNVGANFHYGCPRRTARCSSTT